MACTHHVATHNLTGSATSPTRCRDCGVDVATIDGAPGWDRALFHRVTHQQLQDWGLHGMNDWAAEGTIPFRTSGHLAAHVDRLDLRLDADIDANTRRIQEIHAFVQMLRGEAPAARENELSFAIIAFAAVCLSNAMFARMGSYDAMIRPRVPRSHSFGGSRAALSAVFLDAPTMAPTPFSPSGNESAAIPGGVIFGGMSVAPTRANSGRAPGTFAIDARVSAMQSIRRARIGQEHILVDWTPEDAARLKRSPPAIVPTCAVCTDHLDLAPRSCRDESPHRVFAVVHAGTTPLTELHLELLRLVDVGREVARARVENHSVIPAVDPLRIRDAVAALRKRYPDLTETQAKNAIRAARAAITDQFRVDGLISPRTKRPAPARDTEPFHSAEGS